MDADELRAARLRLGLTTSRFADVLNISNTRTIRRWEHGARGISGPVSVLVRLLLRNASARRQLGIRTSLRELTPLASNAEKEALLAAKRQSGDDTDEGEAAA